MRCGCKLVVKKRGRKEGEKGGEKRIALHKVLHCQTRQYFDVQQKIQPVILISNSLKLQTPLTNFFLEEDLKIETPLKERKRPYWDRVRSSKNIK